jgi:acyl dehydratase
MDTYYFEDFAVGQRMQVSGEKLTEAEMIAFAEQFDPQPMHTDPAAAQSITGGLIASGWHTASLTMGLFVKARLFLMAPGSVGLGVENMIWKRPVRPGDSLHLTAEITAVRPSGSRPDHGIITSHLLTRNQNGEPVLEMTSSAIVAKRNP